MKKEEISNELYTKILEFTLKVMIQNGLKATTMDSIASGLQMSKRTLYEIFGNKEELFKEVYVYYHRQMADNLTKIFTSSENIMEAIIKCLLYNRDMMSHLSINFMQDMHEFSSNTHLFPEERRRAHYQNLYDVLKKGVDEGYFRDDINLMVQCKMFILQMGALKRAEELFQEDISLLEIYDNIMIGFLRSISTYKGLEELDRFLPGFTHIGHTKESIQ